MIKFEKKPEEAMKLAKALVCLENNPDFMVFSAWIRDSLNHHLREIPGLDSPATEKCQGYALALMDIADKINDPRKYADYLEQMKNRKPTA